MGLEREEEEGGERVVRGGREMLKRECIRVSRRGKGRGGGSFTSR